MKNKRIISSTLILTIASTSVPIMAQNRENVISRNNSTYSNVLETNKNEKRNILTGDLELDIKFNLPIKNTSIEKTALGITLRNGNESATISLGGKESNLKSKLTLGGKEYEYIVKKLNKERGFVTLEDTEVAYYNVTINNLPSDKYDVEVFGEGFNKLEAKGIEIKDYSKYILLTNFEYNLELFSELYQVPIVGADKTMPNVSCNGITLVNFGMGSPNAATILDLLSAIEPEAVLFIGKCGGIKEKNSVGDYILPIAAIKGEGTSDDYLPHEVPALPAFSIQKACSKAITNHGREYYTGVVYTTNRRVWEYDDRFKEYLKSTRAMAVDMETATIFTVGFANRIPTGALLLVSDRPMISDGIKTAESDKHVTQNFVKQHLEIGLVVLNNIKEKNYSVKHLIF